jgi:hypothetical protein
VASHSRRREYHCWEARGCWGGLGEGEGEGGNVERERRPVRQAEYTKCRAESLQDGQIGIEKIIFKFSYFSVFNSFFLFAHNGLI